MNKANNARGTRNLINANTKLLDENTFLKKDIENLKRIVGEFENKLLLIGEMYYDDKEAEEMKDWIADIKGDIDGIMGKEKTD